MSVTQPHSAHRPAGSNASGDAENAGGAGSSPPRATENLPRRAAGARGVSSQHERRVIAIRECGAQGMTRHQAAQALGLSYDTIKEIVRYHKIRMASEKSGPVSGARPRAQRGTDCKAGGGTPRRCLCGCGRTFLSLHVGERISPRCRHSWSER